MEIDIIQPKKTCNSELLKSKNEIATELEITTIQNIVLTKNIGKKRLNSISNYNIAECISVIINKNYWDHIYNEDVRIRGVMIISCPNTPYVRNIGIQWFNCKLCKKATIYECVGYSLPRFIQYADGILVCERCFLKIMNCATDTLFYIEKKYKHEMFQIIFLLRTLWDDVINVDCIRNILILLFKLKKSKTL